MSPSESHVAYAMTAHVDLHNFVRATLCYVVDSLSTQQHAGAKNQCSVLHCWRCIILLDPIKQQIHCDSCITGCVDAMFVTPA